LRRYSGAGFTQRLRALEVVGAVREVLAGCPTDLVQVRSAQEVADAVRDALLRTP